MTALNKQALRDSALDMIRVLGYIASFESEDIDGDDLELRFETEDGFDTGCTISITSQCQDAADVLQQLLNELEAAERLITEWEQRELSNKRQLVINGLCESGEPFWEIDDYMKKWDAEHPREAAAAGIGVKGE